MAALETRKLTKEYGDTTAVNDLSFTVDEGDICGFLGPNGAGKTTTIKLLLSFLRPTSGEAFILGAGSHEDGTEIRHKIGFLPEELGLYPRLTARQHLAFVKNIKGHEADPEALVARVGLADVIDDRVSTYSKGMRQRLGIAIALVGEPELLILDEPAQGLDPHGARLLRDIIEAEHERGATVFFSSHTLVQIEQVCDTVCLLDQGELVLQGSFDTVLDEHGSLDDVFRQTTTARESEQA